MHGFETSLGEEPASDLVRRARWANEGATSSIPMEPFEIS